MLSTPRAARRSLAAGWEAISPQMHTGIPAAWAAWTVIPMARRTASASKVYPIPRLAKHMLLIAKFNYKVSFYRRNQK